MNMGESMALSTTVMMEAIMALRGFEAARNMAFIPKNMCDMALPARVITMYSRA